MDETFLTLKCHDCENDKCELYPIGTYIYDKEGCTRKVTEEEKAKFLHYMNEVLPFIRFYKTDKAKKDMYKEIDDYLFYIYSKPLGQKLNKYGKIINPS